LRKTEERKRKAAMANPKERANLPGKSRAASGNGDPTEGGKLWTKRTVRSASEKGKAS